MIDIYYNGQTVKKGAYTDAQGVKRNLGYWTCEDMHIGSQPVAPTCWVALQLMVYYRYLPTSSKKARGITTKTAEKVEQKPTTADKTVEVEVDI